MLDKTSTTHTNGNHGVHKAREANATPTRPADLPLVTRITDNSRTVLEKRYLRRDRQGKPAETIDDMFWRVAYNVARPDSEHDGDVLAKARQFYDMLINFRFMPNSPTFTGAGTPLGQLAACFVLPIEDDMGRHSAGIFQTLRDAALIQQTGGGNGFSFSRLRPKGTVVKSSSGQATGPVGFLRVYDRAFGEIAQGGTRRGANMAVLPVSHPDIEEFITCKSDENAITNFNISVGITDPFMKAVANDDLWELRFPDMGSPEYEKWGGGTLEQAEAAGVPIKVHRRVRARELFNKIVKQAHFNGEPGILFLTRANESNPLPHLYALEATNPCGEQWLGPYENCCLGSVNLSQFYGADGTVDWEGLRQNVVLATQFLDNVVSENAYVPAVPQLREAALRARRIGLGIMGLGDLMYHCGIRYGSEEGQEFAAQIMEFVRYHCMVTSVELAKNRGPFTAIEGSIYDPKNLKWQPPTPVFKYERDFGRPKVSWDGVVKGIKKHGIRNAAQTTIAPTGTIATVAGCESYGCEPVFALAYIRHVNDNGKDLRLTYTSPLFEKALVAAGLDENDRKQIVEEVMLKGSCQDIELLPEHIKHTFVVSADTTADEHVRIQASMQAFVDNSISKTCNLPEDATLEDVAEVYTKAWELGCKGLTVYITGSRQKVVLETHATAKAKEASAPETAPQAQPMFHEVKKPRPVRLNGATYQVNTPLGKSYVTINENGGTEPFEMFISTAKAGSDTFAVSEAIGRLTSYILRLPSPVNPTDRLREVARQLTGIGGGRPMGFGPNRVRSLPDGVAQIIYDYLTSREERINQPTAVVVPSTAPAATTTATSGDSQLRLHIGDLCPECGEATLVNEEGCRKCYTCSYSEC